MRPQSPPVHVLVVDDDAMSRELLAVLLEAEGYTVQSAESGDRALALLDNGKSVPNIVLADVQMPGIAGFQLADALRDACGPGTRLLAMSGSGPAAHEIAHFDGFLMKPFTVHDLAAILAQSPSADSVTGESTPAPCRERGNPSAPGGTLSLAAAAAPERAPASNPDMTSQAQREYVTENPDPIDARPALDERIYNQLTAAVPGAQLHQMYAMCMKDARDRIATMRSFAADRDALQFIRQAHAIKGGCGMLGATEMYRMAASLETAGLQAEGLEGLPGVNPLDELAAACDRLERILGSRA